MFGTHHLHLRRRQLERHGAQVIAEPLLLARSRNRHDVLVNAPAQANLAGIDGVLLRQLCEDGVDGAAGGFGDGRLGPVSRERNALVRWLKSCETRSEDLSLPFPCGI